MLGLAGSLAIVVLTLYIGPCRGGRIERLACVHGASAECAGTHSSGELLSSAVSATVVSGCKCCPLVAILYTKEKQTHTGGEATGHECPLWTEVEMASAA